MYGLREYMYLILYILLILSHLIIGIYLIFNGSFGVIGVLCLINISIVIGLLVMNKLGNTEKKVKSME